MDKRVTQVSGRIEVLHEHVNQVEYAIEVRNERGKPMLKQFCHPWILAYSRVEECGNSCCLYPFSHAMNLTGPSQRVSGGTAEHHRDGTLSTCVCSPPQMRHPVLLCVHINTRSTSEEQMVAAVWWGQQKASNEEMDKRVTHVAGRVDVLHEHVNQIETSIEVS